MSDLTVIIPTLGLHRRPTLTGPPPDPNERHEWFYRDVRECLEDFWRSADDRDTKAALETALRHLDALYALTRVTIGEYLS